MASGLPVYGLIDFCGGGGGFSKGASGAGMKLLMSFDMEDKFRPLYEKHHGPGVFFCRELRMTVNEEFKKENKDLVDEILKTLEVEGIEVFHVHFSPPCNEVSPANRKRNHTEERARLDEDFAERLRWVEKVIKDLKPTSYSIENSFSTGGLFKRIPFFGFDENLDIMELPGFGTASDRKRVFVVRRSSSQANDVDLRLTIGAFFGHHVSDEADGIACGMPFGTCLSDINENEWIKWKTTYGNASNKARV